MTKASLIDAKFIKMLQDEVTRLTKRETRMKIAIRRLRERIKALRAEVERQKDSVAA